jgi:purine-cytosine permease-like protein
MTSSSVSSPAKSPRRFNRIVSNPVLEDYALRYAPRSFRRWSIYAVATAALGGIAYLADYAIGGSIAISFGFTNSFWAILVAAAIIFLTGIPIAYHSARNSIDMDLLTRGAGFGYFGSTLTSLIYASFTFIYFSLEGSVMAQALSLYTRLPLSLCYLIAALAIIPLTVYGMTFLNKFQSWTQPIWLILLFAPVIAIVAHDPASVGAWTRFSGTAPSPGFDPLRFGLATGVVLSLIAQIGEQVDYLRFMPDLTPTNARRWWTAVLLAGPGWVLLGAVKQLFGSFLASWIAPAVGLVRADQPIEMAVRAFGEIFANPFLALTVAVGFVVLSQLKINVTNAYSGSLSWSNFFSRIFHTHPGRVVWLLLNIAIALALMELGVFGFLNTVLGFYSNVAVAWIGAVTADLVIVKPLLRIGPQHIEFKRAHLHAINPVGFGAMVIASALSIAAFFGAFGSWLQAFSPLLSLFLAFTLVPAIALLTRGKYYLARQPWISQPALSAGQATSVAPIPCVSCEHHYEHEDMAHCTFHRAPICSLCCSLEKACSDICKAS